MTLTELRCPRCNAPIDTATQSGVFKCRFCDATLVTAGRAAAPFPTTPENAENPGFLNVMLDDIGPSKIMVIKVVREHLKLGLAEAMHLVEKAPCVLSRAMEGGRAKSFLSDLASVGAKARGT